MSNTILFPGNIEQLENVKSFSNWFGESELIEFHVDNSVELQATCELISSCDDLNDLPEERFFAIFNIIKNFQDVPSAIKREFLQGMADLVTLAITSANREEKDPNIQNRIKKIFYLYQQLSTKLESSFGACHASTETLKAKSKASKASSKKAANTDDVFDWAENRINCVEILSHVMESKLKHLWPIGIVPEAFLNGFWMYALRILDDRTISSNSGVASGRVSQAEQTIRQLCLSIIEHCIGHLSMNLEDSLQSISAAIMNSLVNKEHMAPLVVDLFQRLSTIKESSEQYQQLIQNIISEVSRIQIAQLQITGLKNISSFIECFSESCTASMKQCFPLLINLLDCGAHQIRSAIIHAMGNMILHIHNVTPSTSNDKEDEMQTNVSNNSRLRDSILNMLVERAHDVNPFTRGAGLKVWKNLMESNSIPVRYCGRVAEIAFDRLRDKNAFVRKSSLALLTSVVEFNPIASHLNQQEFLTQRDQVKELISERMIELRMICGQVTSSLDEVDAKDDTGKDEFDQAVDDLLSKDNFAECEDVKQDSIIMELQQKLEYNQSALDISCILEKAVVEVQNFLQSKTASDVVEAIRFFVRAIHFSVGGSIQSFQRAFQLIWHSEKSVKQELLHSFTHIYLTDGAAVDSLPSNEIALNLIRLVQCCYDEESYLVSLEMILIELLQQEKKPFAVQSVLASVWKCILTHDPSGCENTKKSSTFSAAIRLLSMFAKYLSLGMWGDLHNNQQLFSTGLKLETGSVMDINAIHSTLLCLQTIPSYLDFLVAKIAKNSLSPKDLTKYPEIHQNMMSFIPQMASIIIGDFCGDNLEETRRYFSVSEEAIHTIYHLHPNPDKIMSTIILQLYSKMVHTSDGQETNESPNRMVGSVCALSKLLFVLGQTALRTLVYTEALATASKKFEAKKSKTVDTPSSSLNTTTMSDLSMSMTMPSKSFQAGVFQTPQVRQSLEGSKNIPASASLVVDSNADKSMQCADAMEEEMGMVAALDADFEKFLHHVTEHELVSTNLLGVFKEFIAFVVADETHQYIHPMIRGTSIMALTRYMGVSSVICEQYLPLFFTVLENESMVSVRTSIMIALGDLSLRFPNIIEPWTDRMYGCLKDSSNIVRFNTLKVITHLVSNDMIKVKGQITHIVSALNDSEEAIRELARLFFHRLSERSQNPLFNLLGDIIGHFSSNSEGFSLNDDQFKSTMQFLLSFVTKEKQADALLERLLIRMGLSKTAQQNRNLAFCISEIHVSEKGIKKAIELFKNVKEALYDPVVYDYFKMLLKSKKIKAAGTSGDEPNEAVDATFNQSTTATKVNKSSIEELDSLMRQLRMEETTAHDQTLLSMTMTINQDEEVEEDPLSMMQSTEISHLSNGSVLTKKSAATKKGRSKHADKTMDNNSLASNVPRKATKQINQTNTKTKGKSKEKGKLQKPPVKRKAMQYADDDDDEEEEECDKENEIDNEEF